MRHFLLLAFIFLLSCRNENPEVPTKKTEATTQDNKEHIKSEEVPTLDNTPDYNGDGQPDEAIVKLIKEGSGNPIEDGTPSEYSIVFNEKLPDLPIGCCDATIINEGDLDNDGADDFSVFQSPMNGCTYTMTTYTYKKGKWNQLITPILIPTGCDNISATDIEARIFTENGKLYFMETDFSDEDFKLIKKEVKSY